MRPLSTCTPPPDQIPSPSWSSRHRVPVQCCYHFCILPWGEAPGLVLTAPYWTWSSQVRKRSVAGDGSVTREGVDHGTKADVPFVEKPGADETPRPHPAHSRFLPLASSSLLSLMNEPPMFKPAEMHSPGVPILSVIPICLPMGEKAALLPKEKRLEERGLSKSPLDGCTSNSPSQSGVWTAKCSGIGSIWPPSPPTGTGVQKNLKERGVGRNMVPFSQSPQRLKAVQDAAYPARLAACVFFSRLLRFQTTNGAICQLGKSWLQKVRSCWGRCDGQGQAGTFWCPWDPLIADSSHSLTDRLGTCRWYVGKAHGSPWTCQVLSPVSPLLSRPPTSAFFLLCSDTGSKTEGTSWSTLPTLWVTDEGIPSTQARRVA